MNNINEDLSSETDQEEKIKLDYTLQTSEERVELVNKIIQSTSPEQLTPKYLEILSNYIIFIKKSKKEPRQKEILTDNRLITVNKRETSFEGLCAKLENGEDGIYNMLSTLGKQTILTPQDPITEQDIQNIPELQQLVQEIKKLEEKFKTVQGKQKYILKQQIISMRQNQYLIRNSYRGGTSNCHSSNSAKTIAAYNFYDKITIDESGIPHNSGPISFFNPKHIEALLCNYSSLREAAYSRFEEDLWYLLEDLDNLVESTLKNDYPLYYDLLIYKIDGESNIRIQEYLERDHAIKHSVEYISSLWRNKIPKLLAEKAQEQYLIWYYTYKEYGQWKKCSRCGEIKLANNKFFSKNSSSKDGWYSLCKCCRNAGSKKNMARTAAKQKSLDKKD